MYVPRQCTQNTQSHVDYGIPLLMTNGDYRTSYKRAHSFIPNVPQEFDCRVKTKINADLLAADILIKDDAISTKKRDYTIKCNQEDVLEKYLVANNNQQVLAIRNLQEALSKSGSPPVRPLLTEMKDNYRWFPYKMNPREVVPPALSAMCEVTGIARSVQPAIPPNKTGVWKHLDNYMTSNKLQLIPFSENQINGARTDLPTFYNTSGVYENCERNLPGPLTGNRSIFDKTQFKFQFPIKNLRRAQKRVPHSGMQTEYQGKYISQTYSDMYPYAADHGQKSSCLVSEAGPWQNLCPPGMYTTDYSHIGSNCSTSTVIDSGRPRKFRYSSQTCEPAHGRIKGNR